MTDHLIGVHCIGVLVLLSQMLKSDFISNNVSFRFNCSMFYKLFVNQIIGF